jgi:hypothetical protein
MQRLYHLNFDICNILRITVLLHVFKFGHFLGCFAQPCVQIYNPAFTGKIKRLYWLD